MLMKKIICIGELSLNVVIDAGGRPLGSVSGSRVANAAAILGGGGFNVLMASEAASDPVGSLAVDALVEVGVDITSVDRFTEGRTPLNVFVCRRDGSATSITRYESYPEECFDIVWPRIDEGDVVLFGGFYAIDPRMRARLSRLLAHAVERKAVLIYLPGFLPQLEPRITRVMPQLLENLEMANIVMARASELDLIFGAASTEACYRNHIDFYCRSLIAVEPSCHTISYYSGKRVNTVAVPEGVCDGMMWNAGAVAGVTASVFTRGLGVDDLDAPSDELCRQILADAVASADAAARNIKFENLGF